MKGLAPEELVYYEDMEDAFAEEGYAVVTYEATRVYRDKLDVYQVGSIIYTLLTYLWNWEGHGAYEAIVAVVHVSICRPKFMSFVPLHQPHLFFLFPRDDGHRSPK